MSTETFESKVENAAEAAEQTPKENVSQEGDESTPLDKTQESVDQALPEEKSVSPSLQNDQVVAAPKGRKSPVVQNEQVETIKIDYMTKHPLQYQWTLWYCHHDRTKDWEDSLKEVASFSTVEDFWSLYNHIQFASGLSNQSDYYLFKDKIKPMWEAEGNRGGGRWLVKVDKNMRKDVLDTHWLDLLMAMIGEQFEDLGEYICGAVVNIRNKGDKVSLWTRDATKIEANRRIGEILKGKLGISETLYYEAHDDAKKKQNSIIKHKLFV